MTDPLPQEAAALPPGKTCGDCFHFRRCEFLVGAEPTWTKCDWSPSRFAAPPLDPLGKEPQKP